MTELTTHNGKTVKTIQTDTNGFLVKFTDGTGVIVRGGQQWGSDFVDWTDLRSDAAPKESETGIENDALLESAGFPESK